ncbi:aromatic ring-hydroxylating dioxygenase subunit alpha [Parathermosynechococcus lividus]
MLKNFWYGIEVSSAVKDRPVSVVLMGERIVLYRDSQGRIHALGDRCVHRGAALSAGWVEGNCIRCPYHGWTFDSRGECVDIPANPRGLPIPKRGRVNTYPVQEKYGFVWLFWGDIDPADAPPIPDFPQFADPQLRCVYGQYTWQANFTRVMENTIDCSHTMFMHRKSLGSADDAIIPDYDMKISEWEAEAVLPISIKRLLGLWRWISRKDAKTERVYRVCLPNITFIGLKFDHFYLDTFVISIPVSPTVTVSKWALMRNFLKFPFVDAQTRNVGVRLLSEDERAVKTQDPLVSPFLNNSTDLLQASDGTVIAYRRLLKKCYDLGWWQEPSVPAPLDTPSNLTLTP